MITLTDQQVAWINHGEKGLSSAALFYETTGLWVIGLPLIHRGENCYPYDPSDLNRCVKLIETCPECRAAVDKLAVKYSCWAKLAPHWDNLIDSLRRELIVTPTEAPETYRMMKEILSGYGGTVPAWVKNAATITLDDMRRAVNAVCTCGGKGPQDEVICPACAVWHLLKRSQIISRPAGNKPVDCTHAARPGGFLETE